MPSCYRACTGVCFCRHNKIFFKFNEPIPFFARLTGERRQNNIGSIKNRVNLDGIHSLDISVNEEKKTVITELITLDGEPVMIYAEKFDKPCDYLKKGIRKGIEYLNGTYPPKPHTQTTFNGGQKMI